MRTAQLSTVTRPLVDANPRPDAPGKARASARAHPIAATGIFALTIFLGAFLLFQIQPLIAKYILPWFGGGPGVWTTCMLFFQLCLLAGYAYAHALTRFCPKRIQAAAHAILLLAALAFLPIIPGAHWKPAAADDPAWRILLLLTVCVGLPYFALASTGPLLQAWFVRLHPRTLPYRLFALSNLASLLALISYPFLFEPIMTRRSLASLWSWTFGVFAALCGACAWRFWKAEGGQSQRAAIAPSADSGRPTAGMKAFWFALPACGSILLLATTNKLCMDVAAVPFLWIVPLSLYLLTFIISFDRPAWYSRKAFTPLLAVLLALLCYTLSAGLHVSLSWQVPVFAGSLFVGCMICHGELYRLKPAPQFLTSFYLGIAAGGAAGGIFVGIISPMIFHSYAELNWGFWLLTALLAGIHAREKTAIYWRNRSWTLWPALIAGAAVLGIALLVQDRHASRDTTLMTRNFYGVLRIVEEGAGTPFLARKLNHGSTTHGLQFTDPGLSILATTYYNEPSGVGLALNNFPRAANRRVGLVGLGAGTLAVYGRPGDTFRFYEINPEVRRLADTQFTFLRSSKAHVELVPGDARLSLEREAPQQFDLLVLDAFSSDAIPVHLLTQEAFTEYFRHLKSDGAILVHVSNVHLNFLPVLAGVAKHFRLLMMRIAWDDKTRPWWFSSSEWVVLSRNAPFVASEPMLSHATQMPLAYGDHPVLWTDDYASLFSVLKR